MKSMKKFYSVAICLVVAVTIAGCTSLTKHKTIVRTTDFLKTNQNIDNDDSGVYNGYRYDNRAELSTLVSEEYSIKDIQSYFKATYSNEREYFNELGTLADQKDLMDSVNKTFKIECLRKSLYNYYTVYKVKEGGHFFVFWQHANSKDYVISSFYMPNVKTLEEFKTIKEGKSSFEEVKKIDPSVELNTSLSSGIYSYCLLDSGDVLSIKFDMYKLQDIINQGKTITRRDLIVGNKEVKSRETSNFIEQIMNKDLPLPY